MERFVHTNKIKNVKHLREYVEELFASYQHVTSLPSASTPLEGGAAVAAEAARLAALARRWFESIGEDSDLMCEPLYGPAASNDANEVTALGLLNPDNRGLVSSTERVRTIGEEVRLPYFITLLWSCRLAKSLYPHSPQTRTKPVFTYECSS